MSSQGDDDQLNSSRWWSVERPASFGLIVSINCFFACNINLSNIQDWTETCPAYLEISCNIRLNKYLLPFIQTLRVSQCLDSSYVLEKDNIFSFLNSPKVSWIHASYVNIAINTTLHAYLRLTVFHTPSWWSFEPNHSKASSSKRGHQNHVEIETQYCLQRWVLPVIKN